MSVLNFFSLKGKTALITGGTRGIGFALASALGQAGAAIVVTGTNAEGMDTALASYAANGIAAQGYLFSVTDEDAAQKAVASIERNVGPIDILVNNAGILKRLAMLDMPASEFRRMVDVNCTGAFIMAKAVLPGMMERRRGKIINICSMMSELGRETASAYAAAKGGLKMLTRNIASEYGQYNIQCNGIGPGYIETDLTAPLRVEGNPFNEALLARTPAGRWGKPEDLAGAGVFLASSASDFVNGQILYVDGGILAYFGKLP
ncbi:Gluconate 5-dehydrogenase [uncultured delta proteobacterium]|uniref:Gluconate 5-dehydrogenase n=1 Tax=uncultured delta proteobacterium TaxID=34034 RepID=A0A212K2U7_9DELT|nr:Gluconate 5-dehydrogenase [uncultured delta proteobacterium]